MIAWRIIKTRYAAHPLSFAGSLMVSGRWHLAGTPMLYVSATLSLAALETFVHLQPYQRHARHVALQILIPDDAGMEHWDDADLPAHWNVPGGCPAAQAQGSAWVNEARALVLSVPSAVVPFECNLLLNGAHPAFGGLRVASAEAFAFDERLWKRPVGG
ncbi:MAG: RES family NAD+ phosphorylase [Xanthomonadales bacterium]|nr:RES family NAD+ phosphorylase [Xanthomonadales bacterium]